MAAFGGGNPFASGGNPFGGGGGGGLKGGLGMLKKKAKPKKYVELEISIVKEKQWKKNATARMREIDAFRLHVPEEGERREFSIPESTDRVNAEDAKHLMVLCGGYAGVRFTSEELSLIRTSTKELSDKFSCLDAYFKSLPNAVKRISLSDEDIDIANCSSNSVSVSPSNCYLIDEGKDEGKENESVEEKKDTEDKKEQEEDKDKDKDKEKEKEEQHRAVVKFHNLADAVHEVLEAIQGLVEKKHTEFTAIRASSCGESLESQSQDGGGDGDGEGEESLSSKPRPVWLETLLCKYTREVINASNSSDISSNNNNNNNDNNNKDNNNNNSGSDSGSGNRDVVPPSSSPSAGLPPVGSLCAFLSCCALRQVATTRAEDEAMLELIQASSDHAAPCVGNLPENIDEEIFSHTQKYWAQRFFVFMKKLTELKTAMKDEKSLFLFEKFYL